MTTARVIPILLLKGRGLYKTEKFDKAKYLGDPINILRIFNDKEVDEIALLDIAATTEGRGPDFEQIADIVSESFMPLAYGGGVSTLDQAMRLFALGVEKVVLNTHAIDNPDLITQISNQAGAQAVVVAIDAKKPLIGGWQVYAQGGSRKTNLSPPEWAKTAVAKGAGEIMITAIGQEGTMKGYDLDLIQAVTAAVNVPVIAHGGAGSITHLKQALGAGASAVAAGSLFVYQGPHRAVLISYPSPSELADLQGTSAGYPL